MARPSPALRQWLNLRRSLSGASPRAQNLPANGLLPRANLLFPISNKDSCPSRQAFHSSACRLAKTKRSSAKPAPSLQRKKRAQEAGRSATRPVIDGIGVVSNSGLFTKSIEIDKARIIHDFLEISPLLYRDAVAAELLPGVSIRTFEDVIIKILKGMEGPPNAQLIRSISKDVDAVYRIGIVGSAWHHSSIEWFSSSCALAGARAAVVLLQARLVNWTHSPPQTQWTELVKQFSDEGFPPAMILQAKILGLCGQYAEAFELMEKRVLPFLEPTRRRPPLFLDITMDDVFESPWRVYALLHASYDDAFDSPESRQKADEATRIAALEYNDRNALIEYASIMMSEKKYDKYEESMSKAATLGSKKAILYIANFYYQVYLGRFPTAANVHASAKSQSQDPPPAEVTTNAPTSSDQPGPSSKANSLTSVFGWISSFFNQSIPRPAYRNLALDWYYLGHAYKIPQASFMLALMAHEEGEPLENSDFLMNGCKYLDDHPEFGPRIAELKENWYNTRYVPRLSSKMLTVR